MGPDVGAVEADEDRHVADEANIPRRTVFTQGAPLLVKRELQRPRDGQVFSGLSVEAIQSFWLPMFQRVRPVRPEGVVEFSPQHGELRPRIQPCTVFAAE